jgi:hypothetical protein
MTRQFLALALVALPFPLTAQVRASEIGSVSQTVDGTTIRIEYSRPRARGRDTIFGTKAVQWGETWTPGANWATTLDVDKPVKISGKSVAKGKYSVWMVVRQDGNWTTVLEPQAHRYHMDPPDSNAAQIRIPVVAEKNPFTDVMEWSFPEIRMDGGKIVFRWERVRVAMDFTVTPSLVTTLPASDAKEYLGHYSFSEKDSTGADRITEFTITHEDGTLKGRWTPDDPYMKKFALIRVAPDTFVPGVYDSKGVLYEVLKPDLTVEFKRDKGRISSFTLRDMADQLWGTGTLKR